MKTRAAVLYKLNAPLVIEELEIPQLKKGQVLVKMLFSGICRSQVNEIRGFKGEDHYLPHLLGHEASGVIEKITDGVTKVKKGDYVVLSWIKGQGADVSGTQYKKGNKIINSGAIATFSEYAVISENRVTPISRKIPAQVAALLGCAIATGGGVILHTLGVKTGSTVAIFGVGGIGSGAIIGAKMKKCQMIIAVDIHGSALTLAKKLGATHALKFYPDIVSEIKEITRGGVTYAVEASGNATAMESAFAALNDHGTAAICGNIGHDKKICLNPFDLIKGKKIVGSWGGYTQPETDFPLYAKEYLKGRLPLDTFISRRFPLTEINAALAHLEKNTFPGRLLVEFPH